MEPVFRINFRQCYTLETLGSLVFASPSTINQIGRVMPVFEKTFYHTVFVYAVYFLITKYFGVAASKYLVC